MTQDWLQEATEAKLFAYVQQCVAGQAQVPLNQVELDRIYHQEGNVIVACRVHAVDTHITTPFEFSCPVSRVYRILMGLET